MRRLSQEIPFKLDVCTAQFYFVSSGYRRGRRGSLHYYQRGYRTGCWINRRLAGDKARADQIRADLIEERRELDIELSAARQQLVQEAHWREECELLNNELRSLRDINTSLEADLREVTTRLESTQLHAEDKIRQMVNSEQRLSEQFENLANRIFEHSNRRVDEQNRQSLHGLLTRCANSWTGSAARCRRASARRRGKGTPGA